MTKLEQVARAIQSHNPANIGYRTGYALARLAIKAMKNPSIAQIKATTVGDIATCYNAMLDAVLKE